MKGHKREVKERRQLVRKHNSLEHNKRQDNNSFLIKLLLYIGNRMISLDLQDISKRLFLFYSKLEPSKDFRSVNVCARQTGLGGCDAARLVSFKLYKSLKFHKNPSVCHRLICGTLNKSILGCQG
jgi:hypothetical protein